MSPTGNEIPETLFRPGKQVPASGVYIVVHSDHRPEHAVTLRENETFPPCVTCAGQVRFRLEQRAQQRSAASSG